MITMIQLSWYKLHFKDIIGTTQNTVLLCIPVSAKFGNKRALVNEKLFVKTRIYSEGLNFNKILNRGRNVKSL